MVVSKQATAAGVPAVAAALALAACGGSTDPSAATATAASDLSPPVAASELLSRSSAAQRARGRHGPVLTGPPLVVRRVGPGPNDGPEIWIRVRFRLAKNVGLAKSTDGLDRGGYQGKTRGSVTITGARPTAGVPFARAAEKITMGDSHGFTPDSKAASGGWCYGGEVELDLRPLPEARALAKIRSGERQTIRIAVASRGGGTTTYLVPLYDERDQGIPAAARTTGCQRP